MAPHRSSRAPAAPLAVLVLAFIAAAAVAPPVHAAPWRLVGPEGGSVRAIARAAERPRRVFAAARHGGVFRSDDGGASWSVVLPLGELNELWALAVDAGGDRVLAASLHTVHRSDDGGATWQTVDTSVLTATDLALAPSDPDVAYAVGLRLARSDDGGTTWHSIDAGFPAGGALAVAVHPTDPDTAWVATDDHGAWRTTDGGGHWHRVLPDGTDLQDVAADPHSPGTVYVSSNSGLRVSPDGGDTWTRIPGAGRGRLAIDPDTAGALYAVDVIYTGSGIGGYDWELYRSTDAGASLQLLHTFPGPVRDVAPPVAGEPLLTAEDLVGVEASDDGGDTWRTATAGLHATGATAVALSPAEPSTVHAAILDPPQSVRSPDGGVHWPVAHYPTSFGAASRIVAHPTDPERAFVLYPGGFEAVPGTPSAGPQRVRIGAIHTALAVAPDSPRRLYVITYEAIPSCEFLPGCPVVETYRLHASTDGGASWSVLAVPGSPDRRLWDVAVDPLDPRVLWLSASDDSGGGVVLRSDDRGESWALTAGTLPSPLKELVVDSDGDSSRLWGLSYETAGNVLRSDDGGASWVRAAEGLPAGAEANALAAVPADDVVGPLFDCGDEEPEGSLGSLLVGSLQGGVYYRRCGTWEALGEGLPAAPVTDLDAVPGSGIVFAALAGAGLWRTGVAEGCDAADPRLLCLRGGRFRAEVDWLTPRGGRGAGLDGGAVPPAGVDAWGWFWFFRAANAELALKVLDGRPVNDHWWVFYASMTNVAFDLTVTDTASGAFRVYDNPSGALASRGDSAAFPTGGGPTYVPPASRVPANDRTTGPTAAAAPATCGGGPGALCLQHGRFRVEATWHTALGGNGTSTGVPLADDSGFLWFFRAANPELFVKVLDGRPVNGHWWVFYGSLSNVGFEVEVTDTTTGQSHRYENPLGTFASAADTAAF